MKKLTMLELGQIWGTLQTTQSVAPSICLMLVENLRSAYKEIEAKDKEIEKYKERLLQIRDIASHIPAPHKRANAIILLTIFEGESHDK